MSAPAAPDRAPMERCWVQVGVWGDNSCPELTGVGHCRNCPIYAASGRRLLDRPAPADYLESWTALLAREKDTARPDTTPYLVFRVASAWLAVRAVLMREVTPVTTVRRVPHRPPEVLLGLVAVRGEMHPCISLHALFGEAMPASPAPSARMLVARWAGEDWVFPVDEVDGIHDVDATTVEALPATLGHTPMVFSAGLFPAGDRAIGMLDEELLFGTIGRRIA